MNTKEIKKLDKSSGIVWPIKKDEIKRKIAEDKKRQDALRLRLSNK